MTSDSIQNNKLKLLGKLTAGLLHEIRNPLSAIRLNLDLVRYYEKELPGDVNESIDDCLIAMGRIEDLIENLLQYARRSNSELESVSLNELTMNAVHLLSVKASKKNIEIKTNLSEDLPNLLINQNKLLQVLLNLITNAVDACSIKGNVKVSTFISEDADLKTMHWQVEDDGVGISQENQGKIFDDFFTSKPTGTGLGLTVCRSLLEEFGAKLSFKSELGVGTVFTISFDVNK
ncbi:MAG: hypothetical protein JW995_08105 [Melioribacteraceae bacterium]|nr:hypothetical protein [Melioribacteraceae bacterium]